MFEYLDLRAEEYETQVMVAGGINGFDIDHPRGMKLLRRWFGMCS